ncbi:DUF6801 domain-containing protein [Actinomadura fulvescens]|uniref:DUF6801 domain-containing protein n=1 Tax=Actinomadura fulvescens TaxID=46160 RepID=A0ABN3PVG6_9ACTN
MRRLTRFAARTAGWTAVLVTTVLLVDPPPAAADGISAKLRYACTTPSAAAEVEVTVTGAAPDRGRVGEPVRFGRVKLKVSIPDSANDLLGTPPSAPPGTSAAMTGSVRLAVVVGQQRQKVDAVWPEFAIESVTPGKDGGTGLTGSGDVPSVTAAEAGEVTLTAGVLHLLISRNVASDPVSTVTCIPVRTPTAMATVTIVSDSGSGTSSQPKTVPQPGSVQEPDVPPCAPLESAKFNEDDRLALEPPRFDVPEVLPDPRPRCAPVGGLASVRKLGGAAPIVGAAQAMLDMRQKRSPRNPAYQWRPGVLLAHTAPSSATLLGFGFMPTTATTTTRQVATPGSFGNRLGNFSYSSTTRGWIADFPDETTAKAFTEATVDRVSVNGVPLKVGARCKAGPIFTRVYFFHGDDETGRESNTVGSRGYATVDVPAFSGCHNGQEDLGPLLTATVSGQGNPVVIDQGDLCSPIPEHNLPCDIDRTQYPFSVSRAGTVTATAKQVTLQGTGVAKVVCETATLKIEFQKGINLYPRQLGQITGGNFEGCLRHQNVPGQPDQVATKVTLERPNGASPRPGPVRGYFRAGFSQALGETHAIGGFVIKFSDSSGDPGCYVRVGGLDGSGTSGDLPVFLNGKFDNGTQRLAVTGNNSTRVTMASTCAPSGFAKRGLVRVEGFDFHFNPSVTIKVTKFQ